MIIIKIIITLWVAALAFIALCIGVYHVFGPPESSYEQRYLRRLFENCWNGNELDRADAWFRVSQHLRHTKAAKSLIMMADYRHRKALQITSKAVSVDARGLMDRSEPGDGQAVI